MNTEQERFDRYLIERGTSSAIQKMKDQTLYYRTAALKMKKQGSHHPYRRMYVQAAWDSRSLARSKA